MIEAGTWAGFVASTDLGNNRDVEEPTVDLWESGALVPTREQILAYAQTPPELIDTGAASLAEHWPGWDEETDGEHPHHACWHAYWPGRGNVSREVIRALLDAGYTIAAPEAQE